MEGGQLIPDEIPTILQRGLLVLYLPPLGLLHQLPHRRGHSRTHHSARAAQRPLEEIWGIHNSKFFVCNRDIHSDRLLQIVKFFLLFATWMFCLRLSKQPWQSTSCPGQKGNAEYREEDIDQHQSALGL